MAEVERECPDTDPQAHSALEREGDWPANVVPFYPSAPLSPARSLQRELHVRLADQREAIPTWQVVFGVCFICASFWYGVFAILTSIF